jgi:hypothetical protein
LYRRLEQGVALSFQDAANQLTPSEGGPSSHLLGPNIDLIPAQPFERADRSAKYDLWDAGPENSPLAHAARFSGCVKAKPRPFHARSFCGTAVDGIDFPVPSRVLLPAIQSLGHDSACPAVNQKRSERGLRIPASDFERTSHVLFVHLSQFG